MAQPLVPSEWGERMLAAMHDQSVWIQHPLNRRQRFAVKLIRWRERVALKIAPWLGDVL